MRMGRTWHFTDLYLDESFFFEATLIPAASGHQEFYCLEGDGGPCYPASTSCFPSCDDMAAWNEENGYSNTYESFRAYCRTWGANNGNFYGGAGSCTDPTTDLDYGEQYTSPYGTILGRHKSDEPSGWTLDLANTHLKLTVYSSDGNDKVIDWTPTLTEETVVALHVYTPPADTDANWQTPESEIELLVDGTSAQGYYSLEDDGNGGACSADSDAGTRVRRRDDQNVGKTLLECAVECSQRQDCGGFGYGSAAGEACPGGSQVQPQLDPNSAASTRRGIFTRWGRRACRGVTQQTCSVPIMLGSCSVPIRILQGTRLGSSKAR